MNKKHLLWWVFDFLDREHPDVLLDMQNRMAGDAGDDWVKAALAERLSAFRDASPMGYKFLGEGLPSRPAPHRQVVRGQFRGDVQPAPAVAIGFASSD
jgi:hypothetical protein